MRALFLALVPAGVALAVLAYEVEVDSLHTSDDRAVVQVVVGLAFLLCGLIAWSRRPANRLGALMVAAGFAVLIRPLRYSHDALAFTVFFFLGDLGYPLIAQSVLAYPSGRIKSRAERWLVRIAYAMALAFPLTILFLHDSRDPLRQFGSLARKSDLLVAREHHAVEVLEKSYVIVFFGVLAALFVALIARRVALTPPHGRRMLAPLLMAALAVSLRAAYELVTTFGDGSLAGTWIFWLQAAAFVVLPFALLIGLLRAGVVPSSVGELVVELERTPPEGLRDALARGLGDPTLEVAFWLPERGGYGDRSGRPFALPVDGADRAVTWLEHEGEPLAALVHDPSLLEEPELIQAAAAAARPALENARLGAELHAQLDRVKESRARIVAATDAERRRIERDIHDGAQQRLVALALELRSAERSATTDPEMRRMLGSAVDQLQVAVQELRELARGVHPAILTEEGLAAALESLVVRAPLPVALDSAPDRRFSTEVEATAYFVACEGLANVVKHSGASAATVAARRNGDVLVVEVADDGVGAAGHNGGSGLRGLADRVEALGGRLRVESPAGGGTRLVAEIPCAS